MWNCEGLKSSIFMISDTLSKYSPSMGFISETQVFQADITTLMKHIEGNYCYFLNSEDLHDPDAAMMRNSTTGGTLLLWRRDLDPFVSIPPVKSSSFTPLVLNLPGYAPTVHIALYLPTHGRDTAFVSELVNLRAYLQELMNDHPSCTVFIRGDSNVNKNNKIRTPLLDQLLRDFHLKRVLIPHNTYHHFVGGGKFDSDIDVILHSAKDNIEESVVDVICKYENPMILSHHDIVLSCVGLPSKQTPLSAPVTGLVSAPRVTNSRVKTVWTQEGIQDYMVSISPHLRFLRDTWLDSSSAACMSVLLSLTNSVMIRTASNTNKAVSLNKKFLPKSVKTPPAIITARNHLSKIHKKCKASPSCTTWKERFQQAQKLYKQAVRTNRVKESCQRYKLLHSVMTNNPASLYTYLRNSKKSGSTMIQNLTVGDQTYVGDQVPDGFYASMTAIKSCNIDELQSQPSLSDQFSNYEHIIKLCEDQHKIPCITWNKAASIL